MLYEIFIYVVITFFFKLFFSFLGIFLQKEDKMKISRETIFLSYHIQKSHKKIRVNFPQNKMIQLNSKIEKIFKELEDEGLEIFKNDIIPDTVEEFRGIEIPRDPSKFIDHQKISTMISLYEKISNFNLIPSKLLINFFLLAEKISQINFE